MIISTFANAMDWNQIYETPVTAQYVQMVQGKSGEVFLGYRQFQNGKITVKKFENGNWTNVGDSAFTYGSSSFFKLAIAADSTPVVVYIDTEKGWNITVMKFNKTNWDTLGTRGFTGLGNGEFGLTISEGNIFVASQAFNQIKVWYYDETLSSWEFVGSNGIASIGFPGGVDMQSYGSEIFVIYRDNNKNIQVRKASTLNPSNSSWSNHSNAFSVQNSSISNLGLKLGKVKGNLFITGYNFSSGQHESYVNENGNFSHLVPSLDGEGYRVPHEISYIAFDENRSDSFPYIIVKDKKYYGRVYRINRNYELDSLSTTSSSFHDTTIHWDNPVLLSTRNNELFVAYQSPVTSKLIIKQFCSAPLITNNSGVLETNLALSYQWFKDGNPILSNGTNRTFTPTQNGDYTVSTKKLIGLDTCENTSESFTISQFSTSVQTISINGINIHPNPANSVINIQLHEAATAQIYSIEGKLLISSENNNSHAIDVSSLPSGMYIVRSNNITSKFIKE